MPEETRVDISLDTVPTSNPESDDLEEILREEFTPQDSPTYEPAVDSSHYQMGGDPRELVFESADTDEVSVAGDTAGHDLAD